MALAGLKSVCCVYIREREKAHREKAGVPDLDRWQLGTHDPELYQAL